MSDNIVPVEFLTGAAGTGKTFEIKRRIAENPKYGQLASTTGVSAINLDTVTVHSKLGFYDTESLKDNYVSGRLHRNLRALHADGKHRLVIDEVSMLHAEQLDTIYEAIRESNIGGEFKALDPPLGLVLTGDFCQLPPVKGTWAFKANCWGEFAERTMRLTKIWRQADPVFLEGLNLARSGQGAEAAEVFRKGGANFTLGLDLQFDGTTITAKNSEVDRYNTIRLNSIAHKPIVLQNTRWGIPISEWKNIPEVLVVKPTALVMLLTNSRDEAGEFVYANGDLAHIIEVMDIGEVPQQQPLGLAVRLMRNDTEHVVFPIVRQNLSKNEPTDSQIAQCRLIPGGREPYFDEQRKRWVLGEVTYWPMRLGYASTVHKSQGLSLDRVQIDCRDHFFGANNLAYVALSRARSLEGMRIVGMPPLLAKRVNVDPEVRKWL
jgi:hypothetical protein